MCGLTIEKLFVVALLAAVIIGPRRLPEYAGHLAGVIRRATLVAGAAARRAEQDAGVASIRQDWTALDPRQYDPRRIIRDAWAVSEATEPATEPSTERPTDPGADVTPSPSPVGAWVTAGSSGHPRRVWVPAES